MSVKPKISQSGQPPPGPLSGDYQMQQHQRQQSPGKRRRGLNVAQLQECQAQAVADPVTGEESSQSERRVPERRSFAVPDRGIEEQRYRNTHDRTQIHPGRDFN